MLVKKIKNHFISEENRHSDFNQNFRAKRSGKLDFSRSLRRSTPLLEENEKCVFFLFFGGGTMEFPFLKRKWLHAKYIKKNFRDSRAFVESIELNCPSRNPRSSFLFLAVGGLVLYKSEMRWNSQGNLDLASLCVFNIFR